MPDLMDSRPHIGAGLLGLLIAALSGALITTLIFLFILVPKADAATCTNRYAQMWTGPTSGVRAQLAIGNASTSGGSQSVWIGEGGTAFLDIIQVGVKVDRYGHVRYFAAWGRGVPNGVGSLYVERDLGAASRGLHTYGLRLSSGTWSMTIDNIIRLRVPDSFRTWTRRHTWVSNEAEYPNTRLGGTSTSPVQMRSARVFISGAYRLPHWYVGSVCAPSTTHWTFGTDWMKVVR